MTATPTTISWRTASSATYTVPLPPPGRYLGVEQGNQLLLFPLTKQLTTIGRRAGSDVVLDDLAVGARQVAIVQRAGRAFLTSSGRFGAVRLNGTAATQSLLADGDKLQIGGTTLRYIER